MENQILNIEECLDTVGVYVGSTGGISMEPLIHEGRDRVIIVKPKGRLRKYDVALYKRGDKYILHRVVKVCPDAYIICGDNCRYLERGIRDERILGVLSGFWRGERYVDMEKDLTQKVYARLTVFFYPLRVAYYMSRSFAAKAYHTVIGR